MREITKAKLRNGKKMEDQPLPDCWQMNVSITKAAVLINRAHLLRGPNASYKHERDIFNLKLYLERRHDLQQETMHSNNLFFFTGIKYSVLFLSDEKSSTFIWPVILPCITWKVHQASCICSPIWLLIFLIHKMI